MNNMAADPSPDHRADLMGSLSITKEPRVGFDTILLFVMGSLLELGTMFAHIAGVSVFVDNSLTFVSGIFLAASAVLFTYRIGSTGRPAYMILWGASLFTLAKALSAIASIPYLAAPYGEPVHPALQNLSDLIFVISMILVFGSFLASALEAQRARHSLNLRHASLLHEMEEREKTEAALRGSEENYRSFVENTPEPIVRIDLDGRYVFVNRAFEICTGISREDIIGKKPDKLNPVVHPEDMPLIKQDAQDILDGAEMRTREIRSRDADGNWLWLLHLAFPWHKPDGTLGGVEAIARDITEAKHAVEALRASEARYRGLVESQEDLILRFDTRFRFTFVNEAIAKKIGKPPEELLGSDFRAYIKPGFMGDALEAIATSHRPPYRAQCEVQAMTIDGWRWIYWEGCAIRGDDGEVEEIQAVGRDVTERKAAEEALHRREAILKAVAFAAERLLGACSWQEHIEEILEHLGRATKVSCVYILENPAAAGASAASRLRWVWRDESAALAGKSLQSDAQPSNLDAVPRWQHALSLGEPVYGNIADFPEEEQEVFVASGKEFIVVVPIFAGSRRWGSIGFEEVSYSHKWSATEVDVLKAAANTLGAAIQRQEAAEALRASEARFQVIFNNAAVGVALVDRDTRFREVNTRLSRMLGRRREELLGTSAFDCIHPDDLPISQKVLDALTSGEEGISHYQTRVLRKNDEPFWVDVTVSGIGDDHQRPAAFVVISVDITERRRAEEALRASEARLRLVVEQAPAVMWTTDSALRIVSLLGSGLHHLTKHPERFIGQDMEQYFSAQLKSGTPGGIHRRAIAGEAVSSEVIWNEREFEIRVEPLRDGVGNIIGSIGVALDVSERRQLERELLEVSDRQLQGIANDLHDGLGQHLIGVMYLSRRLTQKLRSMESPPRTQCRRDHSFDELRRRSDTRSQPDSVSSPGG